MCVCVFCYVFFFMYLLLFFGGACITLRLAGTLTDAIASRYFYGGPGHEHELNLERVLDFRTSIRAGVRALHALGMYHADLKSDNVLVVAVSRRPGEAISRDSVTSDAAVLLKACITDFGVSGLLRGNAVAARTGGGTLGFAPQEQIESYFAGQAQDIFAISAIDVHIVTGNVPGVELSMSNLCASCSRSSATVRCKHTR